MSVRANDLVFFALSGLCVCSLAVTVGTNNLILEFRRWFFLVKKVKCIFMVIYLESVVYLVASSALTE